jgi:ABC-type Fe3+-hydroxamate transport system substrate-binding protein
LRIKDQLNREIRIISVPNRIISLVPSLTELLIDLGLKEKLVGVTKFCVHPEDIRKHAAVIGGTKKVNLDRCLELKSDFVLANKEENIEHQIKGLSEKGVNVYVSDICNHADLISLIKDLGQIFQIESQAKSIIDKLNSTIKKLESAKLKNTLRAAYLIWKRPYMAAGGDTYISYMLNNIGLENALADKARYPVVEDSDLLEIKADVILLSSEPYPFRQSHVEELTKLTGKKVILVDGEFFSWYGTRILHMVNYAEQLTSKL